MFGNEETQRVLRRIERKLDVVILAIGADYRQEMKTMADLSKIIAQLQADVKDNTDAAAATTQALQAYAKANDALTLELKDALANNPDDTDALTELADRLEANNKALHDAAPATAQAALAGTSAASA